MGSSLSWHHGEGPWPVKKAENPIRHHGLNQERTLKGLCFCTFMPVSVQKFVPLHAEILNFTESLPKNAGSINNHKKENLCLLIY